MTGSEFSDQFDVQYNNITSNQAPGLDEYEKAVFLTKAQNELVKNYFLPQSNPKQAGFDGNQKRQIDFSSITCVSSKDTFDNALYDGRDNSKSVTMPDDIWMIVNERVDVTRKENTVGLVVKAIAFDEYDRLMSKPFKRPLQYQAWRLINNEGGNKADLIVGPSDTITGYTVRYVKRPKPIIVGDLDGLTINGYEYGTGQGKASRCELDPVIHEEIVQRAVELAKAAWTATGQDNIEAMTQMGQRSE